MVTARPGQLRALAVFAGTLAMAAMSIQVARVDWGRGACGLAAQDEGGGRGCLREQPLEGAPFLALGDSARARDTAAAGNFYAIALRRNPRDPQVRIRLVEQHLSNGAADAAMQQLDALLRVAPAMGEPLLRRMVADLGNPAVRDALADRIATDPPWRAMLPAALNHARDPAAVNALLERVASRVPPSAPELALRVAALERLGRAREARRTWVAALPTPLAPLDGLLFDGGFESGEGPAPYGWRWHVPAAALLALDASRPVEGQRALALEFDGRIVDAIDVGQDLVLGPASYRLELQANASLEQGARGFAWTIVCRHDGSSLARLEVPARTSGWSALGAAFQVAPSCPLQRLSLVHEGRNPGERRPIGRVSFDAVRLTEVRQ